MKQHPFVSSLLLLALAAFPATVFAAGTDNVALKCPYVSSDPNISGWDKPGLTDGDTGAASAHCWASGVTATFPKSVTVDLGRDRGVQTVAVSVPQFGSTKTVEVSLSTDNATFTPFAKKEFQSGKAERAVLTGPKTPARYVRLTYPDHHETVVQYPVNYVFTSELEVYECPATELAAKAPVTAAVKDSFRHQQFLNRIQAGPVNLLFLGDSITDFWPRTGELSWLKFAPYSPADFGISGDRTQHVLWRINNGELAGITPKATVLMIGTNNVRDDAPEATAEGVKTIVEAVRGKLPQTKILLLGIFPRDTATSEARKKNTAVNAIISKLDDGKSVFYLDIGSTFLDDKGEISAEIMPDKLHPSAKGYELWYNAMAPKLTELMK
ncbi:MAG: GDSL-type esterase/lipase family protein [Chthoniobacteraceae bacterium]